jgi:hypothetical protein
MNSPLDQIVQENLELLKNNTHHYVFLDESLKMNKILASYALSQDGSLLMYMPFFQDNEEMIEIAFQNNTKAFRYASDRIKKNKEYYLPMLKRDASIFQELPEYWQNDKLLILQILEMNREIIFYLDKSWFEDCSFCLILIDNQYLSEQKLIELLPYKRREEFKVYQKLKKKNVYDFLKTKIFIETMLSKEIGNEIESQNIQKI